MPITRQEKLLNTLATGVASGVSPITREEQYLAYIAGETATKPDAPITRKEAFLDKIPQGGGGGGGVTIRNQNKTITENGTYTADSGYTGLGTVTVDVQASGGTIGGAEILVSGSFVPAENLTTIILEFPEEVEIDTTTGNGHDYFFALIAFGKAVNTYDDAFRAYTACNYSADSAGQSYISWYYTKSGSGTATNYLRDGIFGHLVELHRQNAVNSYYNSLTFTIPESYGVPLRNNYDYFWFILRR